MPKALSFKLSPLRISTLALTAALAGCMNLAPEHKRPDMATATDYPANYANDVTLGKRANEIGWRSFFADQRLEALVSQALSHNRDLAVAVYQIDVARGQYRIQDGSRLPTVVGSVDATHSRTSAATTGTGSSISSERYSIGVGVTGFELDFWGRVKNLSEAARSNYLSTKQAEVAFRLSLIREVASTYFAIVAANEQIQLAEATVKSRKDGLRLAKRRLDAGITSALDYRQSETLLTQAESDLSSLKLARAQAENYMAVLVGGAMPAPLPTGLPLESQLQMPALTAGLPSELLVARPDILGAEEALRAARANVGAARAAFYPSISLTGSLGLASTALGSLFGGDGIGWSFGPSISLPIFDNGQTKGNLTVAQARENIAVASYERTVQGAFREVADALAGRRYYAEQIATQKAGLEAYRKIARLARLRYQEGVVGYLEVLDAERSLFAAEQGLTQLYQAQADNMVTLYIALGGGQME